MQLRAIPRGCTMCGYSSVPAKTSSSYQGKDVIVTLSWTCPNCGSLVAREMETQTPDAQ